MGLAQLAVFLRPPIPGVAKTRLAAALGERDAAALYQAFVDDTLRLCARVRAAGQVDIALWYAAPLDNHVVSWAAPVEASLHEQPDGDLGARLHAAFGHGLARYERVVVIGSDAPTLPIGLIVNAFDALARASMVLGPTSDGGYYAIGASETAPKLGGIRWSTPATLADTQDANQGIDIAVTSPWYDVDDIDDLALLRAHLAVDPSAAPATAERLRKLGAHR